MAVTGRVMDFMRNLLFKIWILSLVCFLGCGRHAKMLHDETDTAVDDTVLTDDSISLSIPPAESKADTLAKNDTVMVSHNPSAKELKELKDSISDRLRKLKGKPLQSNVWGIAVLADAVEVSLAINTPHWRDEFRQYVSDSPHIVFDGPSKPTPISELIDAVAEVSTVKLLPDSSSYSVKSTFATFTLSNDSRQSIDFGVEYIVAFKDTDGVWYRLPHPGIWNDLGITLLPDGKYTIKAALNPRLNNNRPGIYRLYKQIRFDGEKTHLWLMTEFTLQ